MSRLLAVCLGLLLLAVGPHGGLSEAPPLAAAQPAAKTPRVGLLSPAFEDGSAAAFRVIVWLQQLGYFEGKNIALETRTAVGSNEGLPALAAELVRLGVDVLVTSGTAATRAAQQATRTIPIVMYVEGDPVKAGFVQSLGRPGGNITGRTVLAQEMTAKRLALLKELVPGLARIGILWNPANPDKVDEWDAAQVAARQLGVEVRSLEVRSPEGFAGAFDAAVRERCGGLLVLSDRLMWPQAKTIAALAAKHRIPAMYTDRWFVALMAHEGLVSYGPVGLETLRSLATYVDRILKGAKPANLPVEQPSNFELVVNLKTAKALGLAVPSSSRRTRWSSDEVTMDFALSSDQQLLRNAARAFLDERCTPAVVRALWDDARGESEALWKEMARLGWQGLALPEAEGGSGLGMVETAVVLEEMGRAAYPGPYLPTVLVGMAVAAAGTPAQRRRWLPAIATGSVRAAPALLDGQLDWAAGDAGTRAERDGPGYRLSGVKPFVPWAHVADLLLVPARTPEGPTLFLVETAGAGLAISPAIAMDLGTHWATVHLDEAPIPADGVLGSLGRGANLRDEVLRRGAVGAAAEMLGAARRCLDMSVDYAKVREQFGQPIGAFQAIRHKCAEMLLEVENSHSATYYAAWALDAGAADRELAASVAKVYVSEAARHVSGEAIQVHGGIGFTWEYDLHLYVKRAKALEVMYGDADHHRELIVRHVAR